MIKTINVSFDEKTYKKLLKKKGNNTWHGYILKLSEVKEE